VSVQRLKNLCTDATDSALVGSALDWSLGARGRRRTSQGSMSEAELVSLFLSFSHHFGDVDELFAAHGFARSPLRASGKSQPPRLLDPIGFSFRLRRLLGIGVRAEIVRTLLTVRASLTFRASDHRWCRVRSAECSGGIDTAG
jgi:hypothetical protein